MLVAEGTEFPEEPDGCRVEATLALDGLDQDRADRRRRDRGRCQRAQVGHRARDRRLLVTAEPAVDGRKRRQVDRRQHRLVADPVVERRAGDRHRPERPAVEGAAERDDPRPSRHAPAQLERRVDRLRAGVEEHDGVDRVGQARRDGIGRARDRLREADGVDRPDQSVDLGVDRSIDARMVVAERRHRDAVREIEIGAAVGVEQPVTLAVAPLTLEIPAEDRGQMGCGIDG